MVQTIMNNNLEEVNKKGIAVLDFPAVWCGPCQMLKPVFHDLAEEEGEDIYFCTADVDKNPELSQKFGISAVPTILLLKNGKEAARTMGFQPREVLKTWIESNK